jgi:hypothetical protein
VKLNPEVCVVPKGEIGDWTFVQLQPAFPSVLLQWSGLPKDASTGARDDPKRTSCVDET